MVVGDIVTSNARLFPDKAGVIDERVRLTWRQFNDRVNRLANAMLGLGLKKGDRVAIVAENCHEYAEFLFAVAKTGLITVCLNYRLTAEQMIRILDDCEPKAILIQSQFGEIVEPIKSAAKEIKSFIGIGERIGGGYEYESLLSEYPSDEPDCHVEEQDIFRIQYTTGTTGTSKGVVLTHNNEISTCMLRVQATPTFRDDIDLLWAPLFGAGNQARFFGPCFLGATVVIIPFSARLFVEMVERERVTYTGLLPATTFKLVRDYIESSERKYDFSSLRKLQSAGGQRCTGAELKDMLDYFNIPYTNSCKAYGLTESSGPAIYLVPEDIAAGLSPQATEKERKRVDSIGKPLLNGQVRLVDENNNDVPPGQIGEILIKGGNVMKEYWNNPGLTSRALKDGWLHTADLGFFDEDGYLFFEGRKDFIIKSGGLLVGPEEVEDVILQLPAIADVAVIGIHDDKWGQMVTAVACVKPGCSVTEKEIKEHCRQHLAVFQIPKSIVFAEKLPRDFAYGKLNRQALIHTYSQGNH
ncbi:class I adenylate-forming enzyme family protein [Bacteroidota bacterium]